MSAKQPVTRTGLAALAHRTADHARDRLDELLAEVRFIRQYITGRKHFALPGISPTVEGVNQFDFIESIPAGQTFIGRRLTAMAPETALLKIYKNSVQPDNFLEVVTNIQVYANDIPGDLVVEGPATLIAVVDIEEEAEHANPARTGTTSITISGYLIPTSLHKFTSRGT